MTMYQGGPESRIGLRRIHLDYVTLRPPTGRMFVIVADDDPAPAGSVGYWLSDHGGQTVWELGCSVLPGFQGRGIATRSLQLASAAAFRDAARSVHGYPSVDNGPSNTICRKAGFRLAGELEIELRPGRTMRVNDWVLEPGAVTTAAEP